MSVRFSLWGPLAFSHRWLGIGGCLLFILWFVSGCAMMYVRMPAVTPAERFSHAAPLDSATIGLSVAEAMAISGGSANGPIQLTMLVDRPVYRFGAASPVTVFADRGERLSQVSDADALRYARAFAPAYARSLRLVAPVTIPDQWTLQSRAHLPLHHVVLGDEAGTELYVSSRTGDVVMETSRAERFWAYVGPVAHWLYLPVIRRNGPLWNDVIIGSSIAGCVLCITGLIAGVWRFSPGRRFSMRGAAAMSPYVGWMKWHHYAGLLFGLITLTWTFSGLLSMGPFPLLSSEGATALQRRTLTGTPPDFSRISLDQIRAAIATARQSLLPKEMSLVAFRNRWYWIAAESPTRRVIIPAGAPAQSMTEFDRSELELIVRESAGDAAVADLRWLTDYDDYYYDRTRTRSLPVLRAQYADRERTWMYLDPSRGAIALVTRRPDRMNRWLYHGLHSLDFPWLHHRRPLWDAVLILLSIGGIAGSVTSLVPTCRRLRRHGLSMVARAVAAAPARATHADASLTTSRIRSSDPQ